MLDTTPPNAWEYDRYVPVSFYTALETFIFTNFGSLSLWAFSFITPLKFFPFLMEHFVISPTSVKIIGSTTTTTTTTATSATTQSTTTQTAAKTTRTATDAEIEAIYQQVYYAYYPEMKKMTTALEDSIQEKTEEMESLALNYQLQLQNLQIKYANMGLLNSGAYQSAVNGAKNTYSRKTAELSKEISDLKADLEEVEKYYENLIIEETAQKVIEFELSTEQ